ncbi:DUF1919 domain-containing protein [Winogradskyella undariae]|uniref:DUF1919 domain-containing protein n=1 Tax=Winogradskyella undariae TaxID=1285465 RepID=UPI00156AC1D1|nr:DUF1919 domain-containing protein [Winogradskyella undariae]NRR91020.1 DUF1919 domain-containing protein [Winogradskyella undariae]
MRLLKSIRFRYYHYKKQQEAKKIAKLKEEHKNYIDDFKVDNFTIISANCWGGSVYEDLNIPYQSPTIGLFFYAEDYIEFLNKLKYYMECPLSFKNTSKYKEANLFRTEKYAYPIGILDNKIEIHFLHYKTEEEARSKWERRAKRIHWDNIFIACTDRDRMTLELMEEFDNLPYDKKVLFTAKKLKHISSAVQITAYRKEEVVGDIYNERYHVSKDFNIQNWLE